MIDRRAFLGLTVAVPAIVVAERHYQKKLKPLELGPVDTDDRCYDEWLDDYDKDRMHLDELV